MKAAQSQYLEITHAEYVDEYRLRLHFNTGLVRTVDFGSFLEKAKNPDTTDYRDLAKFKSFHLEHGDLVWGDHQMAFPIADLYSGSLLASKKPAIQRKPVSAASLPMPGFKFSIGGKLRMQKKLAGVLPSDLKKAVYHA